MTGTVRTKPMPFVVRAARFVMTLQVAFGLVVLAFLGAMAVADGAVVLALLLLPGAALVWLTGRLLGRFDTRAPRVRWAAVALELLLVGAPLVINVLDSGLDLERALIVSLDSGLVVVLLLLPPSWRWFSRPNHLD
ncbi:hypothetical protein ACIBIZ_17230 [Nonomuraea spiralis]|uniref:hypothetical protein n=1 Tax=Nonomuraea spiralis TaxID=46182 RepID=UPI003793BC0B